ncbi:MAG: Usg family protein [Rhodospirillales bacterium]|nr:Usg family protein [Rhodospirillales bacterium]
MADFNRQIMENYRLTTAEIIYRLPDYPDFLQSFIWQNYDIAPKFPELHNFLNFWKKEIEGSIHSVYVASKKIITPSDFGFHDYEVTLQ